MTAVRIAKLSQMLALFTENEFRQFGVWLQSPWANSNKKLVSFYKIIRNSPSVSYEDKQVKEELFCQLYPGKDYDDRWMRNLMAAICKQAEKFLIHQRLEKDEELADRLLGKEFLERYQIDWYEKLTLELADRLASKQNKEAVDYLRLSLLHDELYYNPFSTLTPNDFEELVRAEQYLDVFYAIQKWRYVSELNEHRLIAAKEVALTEKLHLLGQISLPLENPAIAIYKLRAAQELELNLEEYLLLKDKIFALFGQLPEKEKTLQLYFLINSAARLWLKGSVEILEELMALYQKGLAEGLLITYGRMTEKTYTNIVTVANSLRKFDFVKGFIKKYTHYLYPDLQQDGKNWATAQLLFKQDEFDKCIKLLANKKFGDQIFSLQSKILLLQAYLEDYKNENASYSYVFDFVDALKKYIRRLKTLSPARKEAFLNFVKYASLLLKNRMDKKLDAVLLDRLQNNISQEQRIQGKQWLLEKIKELKNGLPPLKPSKT